MRTLQGIIDRYKDVEFPSWNNSITGYLMWGGKMYYEINSDTPLNLNSSYQGFVLNDKKEVQLYNIDEICESYLYFADAELTVQISKEEYYEKGEHFDIESEQMILNPDRSNKWWGKTLDHYYPHPWFPNKPIKAFRVIRLMPFWTLNRVYMVNTYNKTIISDTILHKIKVKDALNFCEFFEPIYK